MSKPLKQQMQKAATREQAAEVVDMRLYLVEQEARAKAAEHGFGEAYVAQCVMRAQNTPSAPPARPAGQSQPTQWVQMAQQQQSGAQFNKPRL